jgi:SdpC family antimicrobial peptide
MKNFRNLARNPFTVVFMISLIFMTSCYQDEEIHSEIKLLTGEELFKSIIFADGKATALIPLLSVKNLEVQDMLSTEQEIDEYKNLQEELINYIKEDSGSFFINFRAEILSKNPEKISKALTGLNNYLVPFAQEKLDANGITSEEIIREYSQSSDTAVDNSARNACLFLVIPIVAVVAAGVALYAWVAVATWVTITFAEAGAEDKLYLEELSISIAENL